MKPFDFTSPFALKNEEKKLLFINYTSIFTIVKLKTREHTIMHSISFTGDAENKIPMHTSKKNQSQVNVRNFDSVDLNRL